MLCTKHIGMALLGFLLVANAQAVQPMVAAGYGHTVVLKSDGSVLACGNNSVGQLGAGLLASKYVPTTLWAASDMQAVAAGSLHSLALKSDGSLWAWGANNEGQLGDGTIAQRSTPVKVNTVNQAISVAAGDAHNLALRADGMLWAWGRNLFGQLGNGSTNNSVTPILVGNINDVSAVAAGSEFSVALKRDGTVWTWGYNEFGQLGNGGTTSSTIPQQVPGLTDVVAVAAGGANVLALKRDGTVWGWGKKQDNAPYSGTVGSSKPLQIAGLSGIVQLAVGAAHSMALQRDGTVWVWGWNFGGLGNASTLYATVEQPTRLNALSGVSHIAAGAYFSLVVTNDNSLWVWGQNFSGQLANGNAGGYVFDLNPAAIVGVNGIKSIAAGYGHVLVVQSSGKVVVWGAGNSGQLGLGETGSMTTPVLSALSVGATAIAAGADHSLALATDGAVWAWGSNYEGQLGDGTTTDRAAPVKVLGLSGVTDVSAGGFNYSLAVTADGNVWAWGANMFGLLGTVDKGYPKQPSKVIGLADIKSVSAGYNHSLALDRNGSVWAWGWNANGELGDGSGGVYLAYKTTPMKLSGMPNIVGISAGRGHSLVVAADGTAWAWGNNEYVQLGVGEVVDLCIPTQAVFPGKTFPCSIRPRKIPGLEGVIAVSAGDGFSLALLKDGTVKAWGLNDYGQLGNGSTAHHMTPVAIPSLDSAIAVLAGDYYHSLALRQDGTVWAWGNNWYGQLGDGTYSLRRLPALMVNETIDAPLDLIPEVANTIPADKIPPFFLAAAKSGDLKATSLSATLKGGTAANLFAAGYNIYVAALTAGQLSGWWQLAANHSWSPLSWPMAAFMSGVALDSQSTLIRADILQNADLSQLLGSVIYLGYGTDTDEMLRAKRYRDIFTVSTEIPR